MLAFTSRLLFSRYSLNRRLDGSQRWYGRLLSINKLFPIPGLEHRAVQLVASRYTDYAIQAPELTACSLENEKKYSSRNAPYCSQFALPSSPQYQRHKSSPNTPLCCTEHLVEVWMLCSLHSTLLFVNRPL
jgi:hypothetical protein